MSAEAFYRIRFLIDENVTADAARVLEQRGHEVVFSRNVLATAAPDQLLAILGKYESLVIVTHDRDFKRYRKLLPEHERSRFSEGAGRLQLEVDYSRAAARIEEEIDVIEYFHQRARRERRPFLMSIQKTGIKVVNG